MTTLLKLTEAARELRIGRTKVYELIKDGRLPVRKLGGSARVHRADLERFADRLPIKNVGGAE